VTGAWHRRAPLAAERRREESPAAFEEGSQSVHYRMSVYDEGHLLRYLTVRIPERVRTVWRHLGEPPEQEKLPEGIANQSKMDSDANTTDSRQPIPLYGPKSRLVRRSDLVAIGGRSGHCRANAEQVFVNDRGSDHSY
jgi:hypothetical protein